MIKLRLQTVYFDSIKNRDINMYGIQEVKIFKLYNFKTIYFDEIDRQKIKKIMKIVKLDDIYKIILNNNMKIEVAYIINRDLHIKIFYNNIFKYYYRFKLDNNNNIIVQKPKYIYANQIIYKDMLKCINYDYYKVFIDNFYNIYNNLYNRLIYDKDNILNLLLFNLMKRYNNI